MSKQKTEEIYLDGEDDIINDSMPEDNRSEITDMQILSKLLEKRNISLHTTIHNPIGMTAVDQGLALIKEEFGGKTYSFCKVWVQMFRENMIAEDGARAKGIMQAVAANKEAERYKSSTEKLLGDLSR